MADNSATFNLNVTSNGTTDKETKLAKNLNNELEKASKNAARVPKAVAAARQGVDNTRDSGTARGIGGQTGAEGRDFAKQASGLGGLVHVYATFAANLFAISAGFQALSKAANVTNMVSGLDQLGAASGRNLGSIAKQLSMVTDGAVSLQEAMSATAQASSAGMSSTNILRMGEVAKKASQALGRDMTDALSRLSRGITKIEPELLDELGIMVRVDQATQNYARTLGKSASSLTDFEKRQAFANEVLSQAEQKFGNIKLDANPYQKILASIQNLSQAGLELVNKVLGPILNLLAQSPTALTVAMAGLATILLKQAMPAIGQWKQGLAAAAESAREAVIETNKLKKQRFISGIDADVDKAAANVAASLVASRKSIQDINTAAGSGFLSKATVAFKSLSAGMTDGIFSEAQSNAINKRINKLNTEIANGATTSSASVIAAKKTEIEMYTKAMKASEAAAAAKKVEDDYINQSAKTGIAKLLDVQNLNQRLADKANAKSQSSTIISNAASNATTFGVVDSLKRVYADIKNAMAGRASDGTPFEEGVKGMTRLNAAITGVKSTVAVTTAYITTMASALSNVFMVVGIFTAAFQLLSSWLTTNSREAEKFTSSIDGLASATDTLKHTLEFIYNKKTIDIISIDSTQAAATALYELSSSLDTTTKALERNLGARSKWDTGWDNVLSVFGKSDIDKLTANMADAIIVSIEAIDDAKVKSTYIAKLQSLLGDATDLTNKKSVKGSLLDNKSEAESLALAIDINKEIAKTASLQANNASSLTSFKSGLVEINKLVTDLNNSFLPKDTSGKLGVLLVAEAEKMTAAIKQGPIDSLKTLNELMKNNMTLSILPPDTLNKLIKAKSTLEDLNTELGDITRTKQDSEKKLAKLGPISTSSITDVFTQGAGTLKNTKEAKKKEEERAMLQANISWADKANERVIARINAATSVLKNIDKDMLVAGIEKLRVSFKAAFEESGIIAAKGYLGILKAAGGITDVADLNIKKQEINMQIRLLESNFSQVKALEQLNITLMTTNAQERIKSLEAKRDSGTAAGKSQYESEIEAATKELKVARERQSLMDTPTHKLVGQFMGNSSELDISSKSKLSEEKQLAIKASQGYIISATGHQAQVSKYQAQAAVTDAQKPAADRAENLKVLKDQNTVKTANNAIDLANVNTQQTILGIYDKQLSTRKNELDLASINIKYSEDKMALENKIADMELALSLKQGDAVKNAKILAADKANLEALNTKNASDTANIKAKDIYDQLMGIESINSKYREMNASQLASINEIQLANVSVYDDQLNALSTLGQIDEVTLAKKKAINEQTRLDFELQSQLLTIANSRATAEAQYNAKKKAGVISPELDAQFKTQLIGFALAEQAAKATNNAKSQGLAIGVKTAEQQAVINKLLADQQNKTETITSFAESLTVAFGNMGNAIGGVLTSLDALAKRDTEYLIEKNKLTEQLKNAEGDPKATADINDKIAQSDKKYAREQLSSIANVAGATKKLFSEKTAAYKVMSATEKAIHVYKLAMDNKEILMDAFKTGQAVVNSLIRMTSTEGETAVNAVAGVVNQAKGDPYTAFARMAAMAAFMAALTGKSSKSAPKAGFTAEDRQKVNGTGQNYDSNGKIVNTGLGILGNESAKNETVTKGIELISKNSFTGLEFSNKMLDALKAIKDNTGALGKSILSISGIRVKTDAVTGGNWVTGKTSTDIKDAGIAISGTIGDIKKGIVGLSTYINSTSKDSGLFGTGLFGGSSSNTKVDPITDKKMKGQVASIFSSVSDALVEAGKSMGNDAVSAIIDGMDVTKAFDKVSTLGLTGQEAVDALVSQIGLVMDEASQAAFPQLTKFQTMGESFSDTVVRVADDSRVVTKAFESIGLALPKLSETTAEIPAKLIDAVTAAQKKVEEAKAATQKDSIVHGQSWTGGDAGYMQDYTAIVKGSEQATYDLMRAEEELQKARNDITNLTVSSTTKNLDVIEALIKKAGGLDNFVSKVDFFKNNFLTEAERLDPIQKAVTAEMTRLGLASVKTRAEFKKLVLGIDTTTSTGQDLYTSLMNVQEGFSMVYKDIAESTKLEQELLSALGFTYDALLLQRKEELSTLSESDRVMKERIYAVQDANKTEALNQELLDATGRSTESLLAKRKQELRGLSSTDAALKTRIWLLQDEKKLLDAKIAQEVKIYGLLGKSEEALRLTRAQELLAIDPQLAASQLYIYALEDEASLKDKLKAAYDKESSSLKDTISRTKDFIKTLKDYRDSLVLGDNSILTPAQKYAEAKRQFLQVSAIATNIAITDAQKQAQSEAISKLPGISDAFLTASKNIYASSDAYTSDFNSVLDILDKTSTALDAQQTDAQKTLDALDKQSTIQQLIADNTESSAVILQKLLDAMAATEAARAGAAAAGSAAAGGGFTAPTGVPVSNSAFIDATGSGWIHGANGYAGTFAEGKQYIIDSLNAIDAGTLSATDLVDAIVKQGITSTMLDTILGEKAGTSSAWALAHGITGFANGGTPKGLSMVGEQGPELVDFKTPARVYSNGQTNSMFGTNQELLQELKLLREEVAQLRAEQHEQTGNLIKFNYDANTMAADKIANAQANAANSAEWNRRNQPKIM